MYIYPYPELFLKLANKGDHLKFQTFCIHLMVNMEHPTTVLPFYYKELYRVKSQRQNNKE